MIKLWKQQKKRIKTLFHSRELRHIDKNLLDTIEIDSLDHDYEINEVKEEIIKNGMLSPISVVGPYPSGRYFVIDGVRRLNAMEFLGDTEIPCYVIECDNLSKKDVTMLALSCNMVKRNDRIAKIAYTEMLCMDVATGQIKDSEVTQILSEAAGISLRQARKYKKTGRTFGEIPKSFLWSEIKGNQKRWRESLAIWQVRTRSLQLMKRL